jgi:hypothetical protein
MLAPHPKNGLERLLEIAVPLVFPAFGLIKKPNFLGRAAASESDAQPSIRQHIRKGHLLRNVKRLMQVKADDRRSQSDLLCSGGNMQCEQQGRWEMAAMNVDVVLGKPSVSHAQPIRAPDQILHLRKYFGRRPVLRSFQMIRQADVKHSNASPDDHRDGQADSSS